MTVFKFPVLVWRDVAGFYTAALADAEGAVETQVVPVVGYADTAKAALGQVKEYVTWHYAKDPWAEEPTVSHSRLVHYVVRVRPEFQVDGKIFPYERNLSLRVSVVDCTHDNGMRSAVIPRLQIEFFYTQGQLRDLVRHYVQRRVAGRPPRVVSRFLPPKEVFLETITAKTPKEKKSHTPIADVEFLSVIAEPMGTKSFKARYSRPYGRDATVAELVTRLSGRGSNVLLVGERGSGKTSLLLEAARKTERQTKTPDKPKVPRHWSTRGARVIAGMKYLGQWEQRLEGVIEELSDIEGVLCFESLQEMIQTGGRGPESSIAAFLLPYVERGEIVLVAEATPRELDLCRRLLPEFVGLFGILLLPQFTTQEAHEVLGDVVSQLDRKYRVEVDRSIVGECYRLHKRFLPYHSFPGKASQFLFALYESLSRLGKAPTREDVVETFSRQTGLPHKLLKDEEPLPSAEILEFFTGHVIGQPTACQAVTGLVSTFKAGLNDPKRPLGVMLFCGPTGVGKTEMAKTVSRCFFGAGTDKERMIRLDMSEYGGPGAAHRLMGSRDRPGELVKKVRRQPFSVVLLDEIEKAHPDVFDLFLGVFDEGRLTDPWGRETTFRSTVLIMTSNLGVSALRPIGLANKGNPSYQAEVMNFFRPEFFNRIDAVVSFDPLSAEHIQQITVLELKALSKREGLERRGLKLRWSEQAILHLANRGYDARYGARPLKRTIEQEVVVPLARHLVENPDLESCTVEVEVHKDKITVY
jgi:ATP-dependent Clp protease ATP-binding subunit ClpC